MAFSQKLSLRAYSFSFKKWKGKNPEQTLPLNAKVIFNRLQDGEERTYEYTSAFDLIVDFIGANTDVDDKEVRQQLFNCSFDSTNQGETDTYRYLIFTVYAGYYGYASKLVNRKTKSTVHKKSRDEADVKPFYVVVVIPKDTEISKAQRGLILFQEIGIYGVKTVTTKAMQEFFSKKLGLTFRTQNLAPDFYLKKLFESGMIQKIKLARNVQSNDIIEHDWETIMEKVRAGRAHELSEGDTLYLAACTKGANASSVRQQPFSELPAKQRAYSLKSSYMTQILNKYIFGNAESPRIIKSADALHAKTFEEYIIDKVKPYYSKC